MKQLTEASKFFFFRNWLAQCMKRKYKSACLNLGGGERKDYEIINISAGGNTVYWDLDKREKIWGRSVRRGGGLGMWLCLWLGGDKNIRQGELAVFKKWCVVVFQFFPKELACFYKRHGALWGKGHSDADSLSKLYYTHDWVCWVFVSHEAHCNYKSLFWIWLPVSDFHGHV